MNLNKIARMAALAASLVTGAVVPGLSSVSSASRIQEKRPNVSAAENDALKRINEAKDAAAKLDAAGKFVQKFSQSPYRLEVAKHVADHINNVSDVPQRITLTEKFLTVFTLPVESELVTEGLAVAYINADRASDAFRLAAAWLSNHPDQIDLMRILAIAATNESIKGNNSFIKQGREYGLKAIAQIEADRKPPDVDPQTWLEYKTKYLVALHREVGVLAMRAGDAAAAKPNLEKAAVLKSPDPAVYLFLSQFAEDEYTQRALQNKAMVDAAEKAADAIRVKAVLDHAIEVFAQTIAVLEGNAQYAEAVKAIRSHLERYYEFRHGSTQGLQALIEKYKKPAQ
jgi:hypothetical protein